MSQTEATPTPPGLLYAHPVRYLPSEIYAHLPKERIRDPVTLWKNLERLDTQGLVFRVACAQTDQTFVAITCELPLDVNAVLSHFDTFDVSQKIASLLQTDFLLNFIDVFLDRGLSATGRLRVWRVFESAEFFFCAGNSDRVLSFPSKNVVSCPEPSKFVVLLSQVVHLFRECDWLDRLPNLQHCAIGCQNGRLKMLIQGFTCRPVLFPSLWPHPIFGEEHHFDSHRKGSFQNKLEIQKSSHRTTDALESDPTIPKAPSDRVPARLLPKSAHFAYKFAVALCYEILKNSVASGPGRPPLPFAKDHKYQNLFCFFDKINSQSPEELTFEVIDAWLEAMKASLAPRQDAFYSLRDDKILLLSRPSLSEARMLRLTVTAHAANLPAIVDAIVHKLGEGTKLSVLELIFNESSLQPGQIRRILESLAHQTALVGFRFESAGCPLSGDNLLCLRQIIQSCQLSSISLNLSQ